MAGGLTLGSSVLQPAESLSQTQKASLIFVVKVVSQKLDLYKFIWLKLSRS